MGNDLLTAGTSIGAGLGAVRTVTAEELGFGLVSRCTVEFAPWGEQALIRGRLPRPHPGADSGPPTAS